MTETKNLSPRSLRTQRILSHEKAQKAQRKFTTKNTKKKEGQRHEESKNILPQRTQRVFRQDNRINRNFFLPRKGTKTQRKDKRKIYRGERRTRREFLATKSTKKFSHEFTQIDTN